MMEEENSVTIIFALTGMGLLYGIYNIIKVINVVPKEINPKEKKPEDQENLIQGDPIVLTTKQVDRLKLISDLISGGADVFLFWEYLCMTGFIILFGALIFFTAEHVKGTAYTTIAFCIGAFTSMLCGYIGMKIATTTNYRTAYKAHFGLGAAFGTAYDGGCVLGFMLVSISIGVLMLLILVYKYMLISVYSKPEDFKLLFEAIAGFGLGGSSVALFCRVGGGIYTKAADVGADLVAKLDMGLEEDDHRNSACIADNVGDNVGDIAGMGSDLFGSLAEATCAALLVGSTSIELMSTGTYYYPLLITSAGIMVCFCTTLIAYVTLHKIEVYDHLELSIKLQIVISTVLMIPCIILISMHFLPVEYSVGDEGAITYRPKINRYQTMVCSISGLVSGMLIGLITEYYTSMSYGPVKELVIGCKQGAAINIILGLALGYLSNIIPTLLIAGTVYISFKLAGMYGIALAALGMLGNLPICLAIDGYGPISDNAGGLATMCVLHSRIREITDELDSAGNTTAAMGKGFAIGSACLVAFALFGAFVTRTQLTTVNLMTPIIFSGLLFGAMVPFLFSALTMKAVGTAAESMVAAVRDDFEMNRDQFHKEDFLPNSGKTIGIATSASLTEMILPGLLVLAIPITAGVLFGPKCVAGLLIGVIISGIQMATSSANTGGAWDNTKKSIKKNGIPVSELEHKKIMIQELERRKKKNQIISDEAIENLRNELEELKKKPINEDLNILIKNLNGEHYKAWRKAEKASIVGDTVGDPLKDTSGPSLNILIKLSSIVSVVFGGLFLNTSLLVR